MRIQRGINDDGQACVEVFPDERIEVYALIDPHTFTPSRTLRAAVERGHTLVVGEGRRATDALLELDRSWKYAESRG